MKTLNLFIVLAFCLFTTVYSKLFIIKTVENFGSKDTDGEEGQLTEQGIKRTECLVGLFGKSGTIATVDSIFYKDDGKDKSGEIKVNSRRFSAEPLAANLGIDAIALPGDTNTLSQIQNTVANFQNTLFIWSDKEKASILAGFLGVSNPPASFPKKAYGLIWEIDNGNLKEVNMDCSNLPNVEESSGAFVKVSAITFVVAIFATLVLLF